MAEMDRAEVKYSFTNYPGAKHSFTNPEADDFGKKFDLPLQYDAMADKQSWGALSKALDAIYAK